MASARPAAASSSRSVDRLLQAVLAPVALAARASHPRECCGLLVEDLSGDWTAIPIPNTAAATGQFAADPVQLAMTERAARRRGARLRGYFHSHPTGAPRPSRADQTAVLWPGLGPDLHLILGGDGAWALYRVAADGWHALTEGSGAVAGT